MADDYNNVLDFFNEYNDTTDDPNTVVDGPVVLCSKSGVNQFGASFTPIFYYVNFLLSYVGNGLVLLIIYKFEKLHTVTNIFLLNLVISNLLFASSLPFLATYHSDQWIFGVAMCKMVNSAYLVGYYSSVLFLTLMTFDRYLAVVHAVATSKSRKKTYAVCASVAVWCVSVLASLKELVFRNVREDKENGLMCEETGYDVDVMNRWHQFSYYQQFLVFFLLPFLVLMFCYISITVRIINTRMKEKCRSIKLIFIIVFTYFACWTPYNAVILLQAIRISSNREDVELCAESDKLDYSLYVTRNVAYLYCCISPVFYTFVGKKFQSHFKRLLAKKMPCLRRRMSLTSTTSQRTPQTSVSQMGIRVPLGARRGTTVSST